MFWRFLRRNLYRRSPSAPYKVEARSAKRHVLSLHALHCCSMFKFRLLGALDSSIEKFQMRSAFFRRHSCLLIGPFYRRRRQPLQRLHRPFRLTLLSCCCLELFRAVVVLFLSRLFVTRRGTFFFPPPFLCSPSAFEANRSATTHQVGYTKKRAHPPPFSGC